MRCDFSTAMNALIETKLGSSEDFKLSCFPVMLS